MLTRAELMAIFKQISLQIDALEFKIDMLHQEIRRSTIEFDESDSEESVESSPQSAPDRIEYATF